MDTNGALRKFFKKVHNVDIRTGDASDIIEKAADLINLSPGGGGLLVNITIGDDEESVTADKTYSDIIATLSNGGSVVVKMEYPTQSGVVYTPIMSGGMFMADDNADALSCVIFELSGFVGDSMMDPVYIVCDETNTWTAHS